MKRLLKQLDSIKAIVDTFSPNQILDNPQEVDRIYQIYANSYEPIYSVVNLKNQLIELIISKNPVNGYLSADFGYGKTATLVYLWQVCQEEKILTIPPFKFKELADIITACYGWIKYSLQKSKKTELIVELEDLYSKYRLKSQEIRAEELAQKYKISPKKALQIIQEDLKTDTTNTNSVLGFWQECLPLIIKAGFKGLVVFADEIQEFLRTEEGASVRIQVLSDLVKGMRALGTTPVGLILSMPTDPTESAIAEQAGDIIHRMREQKVSLRLADAYTADFPVELWQFLCDKFLDNPNDGKKLAHPATIDSLGQICDRKDLSNAPRTTVEVLKRLVTVALNQKRAYTPLDLSEDYFNGQVQFYGTQQHRINLAVQTLEQLPAVYNHPQGKQIVKLLAMFPDGLSEDMAKSLGMNKSLRDIVDDENLYGIHILQVEKNRYALEAISQTNKPTVVDKVLNSFRKRWFREWSNNQKKENAVFCFRDYILPLLFPASKNNWSWRKSKWFEDRYAWYNFILGSPQRYQSQFPNRSIVISVPHGDNNLMQFRSPESTHLDWRFYLHDDNNDSETAPQLLSIAGTNQVDFNLRLNNGFANGYPLSFGLLSKVITAEQCTVSTLLNLSLFIKDWLEEYTDISKSDRDRLEYHRRECHQYAIRLLFINAENWNIQGLNNIIGSETKFVESVFYQQCQTLFPDYSSFYKSLNSSLVKYKIVLDKIPLVVRKGHQILTVEKTELENIFEVTASGMPSVLGTLKDLKFVGEYKLAGKANQISQIKFTEHPLELTIKKYLYDLGEITKIKDRELKFISYEQLATKIEKLGYLSEELDEALNILEVRKDLNWNKSEGIIIQAIVDLEPILLETQLSKLQEEITELLTVFKKDKELNDLNTSLQEAQKTLLLINQSLNSDTDSLNQLNLFAETDVNYSSKEEILEINLLKIQTLIQDLQQQKQQWHEQKYLLLSNKTNELKTELKQLAKQFNHSKIEQELVSNSELETCLEKYRKQLQRLINDWEKKCLDLVNLLAISEDKIITIHQKLEEVNQKIDIYQTEKTKLNLLVSGLEDWRIILTHAGIVRQKLVNYPDLLKIYYDQFIDPVVTNFNHNELESFTCAKQLELPLLELEEKLNSQQKIQRESFNKCVSDYESLLKKFDVLDNKDYRLSYLCRFDSEHEEESYETLKQVFIDKIKKWIEIENSRVNKLGNDLNFVSQKGEADFSSLIEEVNIYKTELDNFAQKITQFIDDLVVSEEEINKIVQLSEENKNISIEKEEHLEEEYEDILAIINSNNNEVTFTELYEQIPEDDTLWEKIKILYSKGYLEIKLAKR